MYSGTVQPWPVAGYGTGPSCGEQEAPHRPCASVPAGRKEILHLLLCKSPPSSKARVLLLSLANSGCVPYCWDGTCRCCRGRSQWLYIIDVSHRRVPFFLLSGIDLEKRQSGAQDVINGSQDPPGIPLQAGRREFHGAENSLTPDQTLAIRQFSLDGSGCPSEEEK
ncbi:unnamed protein product [Leuciscus chuanchicus]